MGTFQCAGELTGTPRRQSGGILRCHAHHGTSRFKLIYNDSPPSPTTLLETASFWYLKTASHICPAGLRHQLLLGHVGYQVVYSRQARSFQRSAPFRGAC